MKITKYAHACLLVEKDSVRIILDPGSWNETPDAENVHAILITHEHGDHLDVEQIRSLIEHNPQARLITHKSAGKVLEEAGLPFEEIHEGQTIDVKGITIQSIGSKHAVIYGTSPCQNTGYLIGDELYVPGDALHDVPSEKVRILALPTGGPWMRISEAIDYAKKVNPEIVFPIHDAMHIESYSRSMVPRFVGGEMEKVGIRFEDMVPGGTKEF